MSRVEVRDDLIRIIAKLGEGNQGAFACLTELAQTARHYPLVFGYGVIMFEALNLRGASIYMLWNDCPGRSTGALIKLIDQWRNDCIDSDTIIKHVNADGGRGIPFEGLKGVLI